MKPDEIRGLILHELLEEDPDVRHLYIKEFAQEVEKFSHSMTDAFIAYREFDLESSGNEKRAYISGFLYSAITFHVLSLKLLLSGYTVPAGNVFRLVLECASMAVLSSSKELTILKRFMEDKYSTSDAVDQLLKHHKKLGVNRDSLDPLKRSQDFYHKFSHITKLSIGFNISFTQSGMSYFGASFDSGKLDVYKTEINQRLGFAKVFPSLVRVVSSNVAKW